MAARTVHLVDASPYVFRAFFSLPESLRAPDGSPVNAVSGFRDFLLRLLGSSPSSGSREGTSRRGAGFLGSCRYRYAGSPVSACPTASVWMSCVPS